MMVPRLAPGQQALHIVAGILLVLVLPGYAVVAALPLDRTLATAERALATLGASLAVVALSGVVLNITPWGLQTASWTALLGGITLLACAVAAWRRWRGPAVVRYPAVLRVAARDVLLCALALLVAGGALGVARYGALHQSVHGFTQMWLLPQGHGNRHALSIGLRNMEDRTMTYRLQLKAGGAVVFERPSLTLRPSQTWQRTITVPATRAIRVVGLLYRADAPRVLYRYVTLWRH
jgi:uncharacterized membrane protein